MPQLLIIEDDESLLGAMLLFFSSHGFEVKTAKEAEEAVAMARHYCFDLIIADLGLNSVEGLDGLRVLKLILQSSPGTKIIVCSGHSDPAVIKSALRRGACTFIPKPASLDHLLTCARELCLANC
jgi:two-component system response regulator RegA